MTDFQVLNNDLYRFLHCVSKFSWNDVLKNLLLSAALVEKIFVVFVNTIDESGRSEQGSKDVQLQLLVLSKWLFFSTERRSSYENRKILVIINICGHSQKSGAAQEFVFIS